MWLSRLRHHHIKTLIKHVLTSQDEPNNQKGGAHVDVKPSDVKYKSSKPAPVA